MKASKKLLLWILPVLVIAILLPHVVFSYRPYNIILITIDTLRADYLTCYNPKTPATPNIDRIAKQGVLFTNAYSLIPITLPSHSSIFTSRPPHELFVFNNGDIFGSKNSLLAEDLSRAGYHTGAFISLAVLKSTFGLDHGFQTYADDFGKYRWYRLASEINAEALPWIEKQKGSRFFAWIHYSDPHEPYIAPDAPPDTEILVHGRPHSKICVAKKERTFLHFQAHPGENLIEFVPTEQSVHVIDRVSVKPEDGIEIVYSEGWKERLRPKGLPGKSFDDRAVLKLINKNRHPVAVRLIFRGDIDQSIEEIRRNYAAEVQFADKHVGLLWQKLQQLGLLDKTIVILTADHGEALGNHTRIGHLYPLHREITQIPLLIYYPHLGRSGKHEHKLANLLDIKPTILDLLHLKSAGAMQGNSLKRYISWSPIDWLLGIRPDRSRTFVATFAPQGRQNSFAIIHGDVELIETHENGKNWKWEGYDLANDPMEQRDLRIYQPEWFESKRVSSLRSLLEEYGREAELAQSRHRNPELSEEQKRMLRDLGYVAP